MRSLRLMALLIKDFYQKQGYEHDTEVKTAVRDMTDSYPNFLAAVLVTDDADSRTYPTGIDARRRHLLENACRRPAGDSLSTVEIIPVPGGAESLMIGRAPILFDPKPGHPIAGLLCAAFRLPDLPFSTAPESRMYAWELRSLHPETGREERLAASAAPLRGAPQESLVSLPDTTWVVGVTPPLREIPFLPLFAAGASLCVLLSLESAWLLCLLKKKKHLERVCCTDPLTGLPNRRLLLQTLEQMVSRKKAKSDQTVAVCYVDLDDFKGVNDTLGHKSGDLLLAEFAERLSADLECGEIAARIGGDEFVLLLRVRGREECGCRLKALLPRLQAPFRLEQDTRALRISIGVAFWPEHGASADALLRHADQAMYHAKTSGGEGICFSPPNTGCQKTVHPL